MSEEELYELLKKSNIKVAYDHFTKKVSPPFILYRVEDITAFNADNINYIYKNNYIVDFCSDKRDLSAESVIETLFNDNELPFEKEIDFLESEKMYQVRYFL